MNRKKLLLAISIFLIAPLVTGAMAIAGMNDIKSRMKSRLPEIVSLKAKGIIGENNKGYLQFTGADRTGEAVVRAENADRKAVYEAIAKQQGTTADVVGVHRAAQIAQKAAPGELLQDANGKWYHK